ncbi:MAG: hypothetical protein HRU19_30280 [Pseudobacteriovorax sp.]|nr:hypothetical protein [Pseudobacteriovorax sp.]
MKKKIVLSSFGLLTFIYLTLGASTVWDIPFVTEAYYKSYFYFNLVQDKEQIKAIAKYMNDENILSFAVIGPPTPNEKAVVSLYKDRVTETKVKLLSLNIPVEIDAPLSLHRSGNDYFNLRSWDYPKYQNEKFWTHAQLLYLPEGPEAVDIPPCVSDKIETDFGQCHVHFYDEFYIKNSWGNKKILEEHSKKEEKRFLEESRNEEGKKQPEE